MDSTVRSLRISTSLLASQLRGWRGVAAYHPTDRAPERLLELYEFEGCPFCRLVREALTEIDLDAMIYPCPSGGTRFRPRAQELGGKLQFPLLVDPNTGRVQYESADIIAYLAETYAARPRAHRSPTRIAALTSGLSSLSRGRRGINARPSKAPAQPLELYSFEGSPFARPVRETLAELELPYLLRSTGKARREDMGPPWVRQKFYPNLPVSGRNRLRLLERAGRVQVPYLIDPNTGVEMFESAEICAYLERTYSA